MNKPQLTAYWQDLPWNTIKLKANKYLPEFIFVVLIILITQTFAELTWHFFTPAQESVSSNIQNQATQTQISLANLSLQKVSAYHLFGDARKQVLTQQKIIDAPETRLRLNLKGVFASSNAAQALAIISSSKGKDKTYHIGDKITGGALLHAVYTDRVILKRNGQLETLRLPQFKVDSKSFYNQPSSASIARPVDSTNQSKSQRLRKMRDTLLHDPAKLWQQVRINPVMKNGKIKGYTLTHNDQALMKALNIRASDIITSVNGQSLSDPSTLYGLMNSLADQQSLLLNIERNGQQQTVELTF